VVLEKISWTDHVRNEEVLRRVKEEKNTVHTVKSRKGNWIGHILCRDCLLKQVMQGNIVGRIEVTVRRGRRRKQLLDIFRELQLGLHPVAVIHYAFKHKRYTEQHSDTEYTELNITPNIPKHNNKPYKQQTSYGLYIYIYIYIYSNNGRHPVTKNFTALHYISPSYTSFERRSGGSPGRSRWYGRKETSLSEMSSG
jgi:hypothetical protein